MKPFPPRKPIAELLALALIAVAFFAGMYAGQAGVASTIMDRGFFIHSSAIYYCVRPLET